MKTESESAANFVRHIQCAGVEFVLDCGGIDEAIREIGLSDLGDEKKVFPYLANEIERMRKEGKL